MEEIYWIRRNNGLTRLRIDWMSVYRRVRREVLTKKSPGETGAESRLTAQSMNVWLPRMAKTMVFISSMGTDLITIAFVPIFQLASTCASLSLPEGLT